MNACRCTLMRRTADYWRPMRHWLSVAAVLQRLQRSRVSHSQPLDAACKNLTVHDRRRPTVAFAGKAVVRKPLLNDNPAFAKPC